MVIKNNMSYETVKAKLERRRSKPVRFLTKRTYAIIISERNDARDKFNRDEDTSGCYEKTKQTNFYQKEGGAYCELLSVLS